MPPNPAPLNRRDVRYPWTRFLCPREGSIRLGADGYPIEPRGHYGAMLQPDLIDLNRAIQNACAIILGEAGIGKSDVVNTLAAALRGGPDLGTVIALDLGTFGDAGGLDRELFESAGWRTWLTGTGSLHLILDGLDEAMAGISNVVGLLQRRLRDLPFDRLHLVISCRTAAWPETLTSHLAAQFGAERVGIYEVVPLLRGDVVIAAEGRGVSPESFLDAVAELGAQPLASNPASLNLLLGLYSSGAGLPRSQVELYERGLTFLCEPPRERRDRGTASDLTADQLLEVAARVAALTILTGRAAVHTGAGEDAPSNAIPTAALLGGTEGRDGARIDVSDTAVAAALRTGIFTARGPELFGPAHKTYGEFLAARYLSRSGLSPKQRDSLLYLPDERPRRLVPQLQETAAWLAGMDLGFFNRLLAEEPEVLLMSDVRNRDAAVRAQVVDSLLARTEARQLSHDQRGGLRRFLRRLAHPMLGGQLRRVINDPAKTQDTRDFAIDVADACDVKETAEDLAALVVDSGSPFQLRVAAGYAVCKLGVDSACARLKPLAFGDGVSDPDDQLRGLSLRACWPRHLTAQELFSALETPRTPNFHGSYAGFLWKNRIAQEVTSGDLPLALKWAEQFHARDPDRDDLSTLAAELATRAWREIVQPEVGPALARLVFRRYRDHGCPFYIPKSEEGAGRDRNDLSAVNAMIQADPATRRELIDAIVGLAESAREIDLLAFSDTPLPRLDDFGWLLERAGNSVRAQAVIWAGLARDCFDRSRSDHVDLWLAARARSPIVAQVMNYPLLIDLDTPEARKAKAEYLRYSRSGRRTRPTRGLDRSPSEIVQEVVQRCLTDQPGGFWYLGQILTLKPDGTYNRLAPEDLRTTPGWKDADPETRKQILRAALRFLGSPPDDPAEFLQRDNTVPISDLAAPQAMVLLIHEDPAALNAIPTRSWEGWAPNVLAQFAGAFNCKSEDKQAICRLLRQHAPTVCRESVLTLIGQDEANSASIIYVWDELLDADLAAELVQRFGADDYSVAALNAVVSWLLRCHAAGTDALVERFVPIPAPEGAAERERSVAIAAVAAQHAADRHWPRIWTALQADAPWGRAVVERIGVRFDESAARFLLDLSDGQCGTLLEWLFRQYPPENDPERSGVYSPTGADNALDLRRLLQQHLEIRGTPGSCEALRSLRDAFPQYRWLNDSLLRSQVARRRNAWNPPSPHELRRLAETRRARYVSGPGALLDLIVESLERLSVKLHGELPASSDMWDKTRTGRSESWRPKDEGHLSDYIARHLKSDLAESGIVVNREVQIRRRSIRADDGGAPGQEVDIVVEAFRPGAGDGDPEVFRAITEVKGCWHPEIRTAMRTQLVERYLRRNQCCHGLYIVGWFAAPAWDENDSRKAQVPWATIEEARRELEGQAQGLCGSADAEQVRAVVLDCSLR